MLTRSREEPRKLELISLVDVVFMLLIFFIIALAFGFVHEGERPGKGSGLTEKIVDLPKSRRDKLSLALTPTRCDTVTIVLAKKDSTLCAFMLDNEYRDEESLMRLRQRLINIREMVAPPADSIMEARRLFREWHSHVVEANNHGDDVIWDAKGPDGNFVCRLERYRLLLNNWSGEHDEFLDHLRRTLDRLIRYKTEDGCANLKFVIAAHHSIPYRLVYDIIEDLDRRSINIVHLRLALESL